MQIGVVFPQTEIGGNVDAVRAYAERVEALGFAHVLAYDHVLGADPEVHKGWAGPYDVRTTFHEPFVLFGYLAAITSLELVTGIIILPQRQTALVAKQAAEVDLLTNGKFRMGVGTPSSTKRLARTSPTAAGAWKSRSDCSAGCGPSRR
jgi:alkanesulfonate monooxygenase SsuD/methylene tetrahydromethanopterin reductase-like flavin-dependent oxidoreductase (luciferase family)